MRLLLDENLSDKDLPHILDLYPGSTHVKSHDLMRIDGILIRVFAQQQGYSIVSKDADFHQRSRDEEISSLREKARVTTILS